MIHRNFNFLLMNQCKAHDLEVVRVWIWNARHNINSPFWSLTCHLTMHATLGVVDLLLSIIPIWLLHDKIGRGHHEHSFCSLHLVVIVLKLIGCLIIYCQNAFLHLQANQEPSFLMVFALQ
jgi:hypothetical protein